MCPHTERHAERGAREDRRVPTETTMGRGTALVIVGMLVVGLAMVPAGVGSSARNTAALRQEVDTVRVGDRRCLTRRAEDCLDEPVPADEPHGALCATCHNLWERVPADESVRSCSDSECHANPAELSGFHRTVHAGTLENCLGCHAAHDARMPEGSDACTRCHATGGARVEWAGGGALAVVDPGLAFRHGDHPDVACVRCHAAEDRHGTVTVGDVDDCRGCHHQESAAKDCQSCHTPKDFAPGSILVTRILEIQVGSLDRPERQLPFDHARHDDVECAVCHGTGLDPMPASDNDCSSCHAEHHTPDSRCYTCHLPAAEGAHDVTTHLGCEGSGCHTDVPAGIASVPRTRAMCQSCHVDQVLHKPEKNCTECHILPELPPAGR